MCLPILASAALGHRVAVCERTDPSQNHTISRSWKYLRRLTYRWAAAVVAQTGDAARWLDRQCGVRSLVIPNAIRRMPDVQASRSSTIFALRTPHPREGHRHRVAGVFLPDQCVLPEWRVVIAGDGPERAALMNLRKQLDLEGRVDFVGQVWDVENWLAAAGLVVHAPRREDFRMPFWRPQHMRWSRLHRLPVGTVGSHPGSDKRQADRGRRCAGTGRRHRRAHREPRTARTPVFRSGESQAIL